MKTKRTVLFSDYKIPAPDQAVRDGAIRRALAAWGPIRRETGILAQIRTQMTYLGIWFWIGLAAILVVLLFLRWRAGIGGDLNVAACAVLAVAGPLLVSLTAPVLSRSHAYGMWELEDSSFHNLPRLTALRLMTCGLAALPVAIVLLAASVDSTGMLVGLEILLVPLLVSSAAVFLILGRMRGNGGSLCSVGACLVITVVNWTLFTGKQELAAALLAQLSGWTALIGIAVAAGLAVAAGRRLIQNASAMS